MLHSKTVNNESVLTCITCDKQFASEHSIKQHMQSKHSSVNNQRLPVGHPQRYQKVNLPQNIACVQCGEIFPTRRDVDDHMTVHTEENNRNKKDFVNPWKEKTCRYYRNGNCFKGDRCAFILNTVKCMNTKHHCVIEDKIAFSKLRTDVYFFILRLVFKVPNKD